MAVVTPLNNFLGPEGDTVTVDEQLLNTQYSMSKQPVPCKLVCVCESSCLGDSKTMVGTQGGRGNSEQVARR